MLESMIVSPPESGIWGYNSDVMLRVIKEPVAMTMSYVFSGSAFTIHYESQDVPSSGILIDSSTLSTFSVPANVTEFFLKQVTPGVTLSNARVTGPNITEVFWNPKLRTQWLYLRDSPKLTKVSEYLPQEITDLSSMFRACSTFNQELSGWDTSSVTNMNFMFQSASAFNQDVSTWDVSNVTNMGYMFYIAKAFNQDISSWDTGNVTNISAMFYGATVFNQNLSGWNVSKVTNHANFDTNATAWQADFKPKFT